MTNFSLRTLDLPTLHRHAIGFDRIFDELNRTFANSKTDGNYPPHNIVQIDETHYAIQLAVSGFSEDELDSVDIVVSRRADDSLTRPFLASASQSGTISSIAC